MPKKKSYQSWCKSCKFYERNLNKCIACMISLSGDMEMPSPPQFVKKVKE